MMALARRRSARALALALLLGACASGPPLPPEIAARPELAEIATTPSVLDIYDPIEPFNRAMYHFNAGFDRYIFLPIVRAYELVTPDFVENRVSDFFNNLRDATGIAAEGLLFWLLTPGEVQESLAYRAVRFGLQPIDTRHQLAFRYYQTDSPFEYELVRLLYTQTRRLEVAN